MTSIAQNRENDQREIGATLKKFFAEYGAAENYPNGTSAGQNSKYVFAVLYPH